MRLPVVWGKIGGVSLLLFLAGCSSSVDDDHVGAASEDLRAATANENPCLDAQIISMIKDHIKNHAEELIATKYRSGAIDSSLLYSADISFNYISQPTTLDNGDLSCSAEVTVLYQGNQNSESDVVATYAKLAKTNIEYNSNPFANLATGYNLKQELGSLGVDEFAINEFSGISENSFTTRMDYEVRTTQSEDGQMQRSYMAGIAKPAAMLATVALLDNFMQKNKKPKGSRSDQSSENQTSDTASYDDHTGAFEQQVEQMKQREKPHGRQEEAWLDHEDTDPNLGNEQVIQTEPIEVDTADVVIVEDPAE